MKKEILAAVSLLLTMLPIVSAQENVKFEPSGKVSGTVFMNYHYDMTEFAEKRSQFEMLRSYFGYQYGFSEKFTAKITFDIGNDGKAFSAFLKNSSLEWKICDKLAIEGGMISTHIFDTQEKFNGYRYILESLQDKEKFYSSADLGIKATFRPSGYLEFHAGLYNGEGYKKIQDNFGVQKTSFDVVIRPLKGFTFKAYYDFMPKRDTSVADVNLLQTQSILNFFAGYELTNVFRAGLEYDVLNNSGNVNDRGLTGISAYGTVVLKRVELFFRYDQLSSNILPGGQESWNLNKDFNMILAGLQFSPVKGVKTALDYRHYIPAESGHSPIDLIYFNLEFKF